MFQALSSRVRVRLDVLAARFVVVEGGFGNLGTLTFKFQFSGSSVQGFG